MNIVMVIVVKVGGEGMLQVLCHSYQTSFPHCAVGMCGVKVVCGLVSLGSSSNDNLGVCLHSPDILVTNTW